MSNTLCNMLCFVNKVRWMHSKRFLCTCSSYICQAIYNTRHVHTRHQKILTNVSACGNSRFSSNIVKISPVIVQHDLQNKRFFVEVENVGCAFLEYERENQYIKLMHTEVPVVLGGRGLGQILAKESLEYVAKNDFLLEIHCSFVRNYVSKYNPKYIKHLKQ